jgi:ATP-dependent Lon protease
MKESAQAALSYVRSRAKKLGIKADTFAKTDLHVHVPAGAIPKDGPSAGITMASSIASAFTGKAVNKDIAMTGEATLRGRVLPVGGLKEKTLAAKRMGIKKLIVPSRNKKDVVDIPKYVKKDMEYIFVEEMDDVLKYALKKAPRKARPAKKRK